MLKDLGRLILNIIIVSIGLLLTYLCWNYLGSDRYDPYDISDDITLGVICATALILYYVNKPPKNAINSKALNSSLTQLSILLYHMLIETNKELVESELFPDQIQPILKDKTKHPIFSCQEIAYTLIESSLKDLAENKKDYSQLIAVLQSKENPLRDKLYDIRRYSKEQKPELLEKINNILYQLEKINQKNTYTPQMLYKELNKLLETILETCEHIKINYPDYNQKDWS